MGAAAMLTMIITGTEGTGAFAQAFEPNEIPAIPAAQDAGNVVVEATGTSASEIVFVAEPVVQSVPDEPEADVEPVAPVVAPKKANSLSAMVRQTRVADGAMDAQMQCLASAVYFESRGEPLAGQLAVAMVVKNRAASRRFPASYCRVVKQRGQFSFVRSGRIPTPRKSGNAWRRAKAIAHIAHSDLWKSEAGESLYFHANYVRPAWAARKKALARIDTHIFYR